MSWGQLRPLDRLVSRFFGTRQFGLAVVDTVLVVVSWSAALTLRFDGSVREEAWIGLASVLPAVVAVSLVANAGSGVYAGIMRFASVLEARQILIAQAATVTVMLPIVYLTGRPVPLSVPIIATVICCSAAGATRFWSRLVRWRQLTATVGDRIVVVGATDTADALLRDVERHGGSKVVALVDDRPWMRGRRFHGVAVRGAVDDLAAVLDETPASRVVLALDDAPSSVVRSIADVCAAADVAFSLVPTPAELLGRQVSLQDVRDLEIADLLGRPQVDTDLDEVRGLLSGRRVLITGGGGSIGSELARQVASFGPAALVLVDHDETHLFDAAATVPGARQCLQDVCDRAGLARVFREERPEIIFHAAAHKHVPLLEDHPGQAAHTNIVGTRNVVECAQRAGVERLVFISTDKAVRPSSVMGTTKLVGEHLALGAGHEMTACAVRFGNVLGSRGSVVPTFVKQIRAGGPVTITDGRMTRYFMSIPEAVRLVLHAAALSTGGEIFMLDMGEPVRIIDLAKRMIQMSGQRPGSDVEIRVTGIRPGEKLAEVLCAPDEPQHPTRHPCVVRLEPARLPTNVLEHALASIESALAQQDDAAVRSALAGVLAGRDELLDARDAHDRDDAEVLAWT